MKIKTCFEVRKSHKNDEIATSIKNSFKNLYTKVLNMKKYAKN